MSSWRKKVRYFRASVGFAIGGVLIIAILMAIEIYVRGYTYRNSPSLGNFIFGVVIFVPYVLCASLGFAVGLRVFQVSAAFVRSLLVGAAFVIAVGLFYWATGLKPFHYSMIAHGTLLALVAVPSAMLARGIARPSHERLAS